MRHHQGTAADPPGSATAPEDRKGIPELTRVHRVLIGVVVAGAVVIASIGFAGSYAAVRELALQKGFGKFSLVFPIGVDAGIVVLLALDLLLTWIRIPFPLLRQTAWLLTAATIAFNAASAWPDPLGVGMHGVIPVLFVVSVEAARHAVGRIADITADKHMEGVRLTRWLLSPVPTFKLWRRMKLWELRSYEQVIKLEQERLVYQARLRSRFGRAWRRKAPVEAMMPLRLARYGVPLAETAPAGLAAAGIHLPAELEPADVRPELTSSPQQTAPEPPVVDVPEQHGQYDVPVEETAGHPEPEPTTAPEQPSYHYEGGYDPTEYELLLSQSHLAGAAGPVAARNDGRPRVVQARIDGPEWDVDPLQPLADEVLGQSPIGDGQGGPYLPRPATEPVPPVYENGGEDMDEVSGLDEDEVEPQVLTGVELLEYRYVRLSPEQRALSGVKLGELLHEGTGFTPGTARKYLKPIIEKHG